MALKYKNKEKWEMLSFSLVNLTKLTNDMITKQFQNKYDKDFDKYDFDIIEIKESETTDRVTGVSHYVTIIYGIEKINK